MNDLEPLTDRQRRELEYHREHAKQRSALLDKPVNFNIALNNNRRWWNAHWAMYTYLRNKDIKGKNVLVVGCGFGDDALYLPNTAHMSKHLICPPNHSLLPERSLKKKTLRLSSRKCLQKN